VSDGDLGKIKLLHLSDIHFGISDHDDDQVLITDSISRAVEEHIEKFGIPQICIFSGDLTQRGGISELNDFEAWLETLFKDSDKERIDIFIVPGNHEVERPELHTTDYFQEVGLRRSAYSTKGEFNKLRNSLIKPPGLFSNFISWHSDFAKKTKYNVISNWNSNIAGCCTDKKSYSSIDTKIIGLNTALLSCNDDDEGKLVADRKTLNQNFKNWCSSSDLLMVVGHHPIGKLSDEVWLTDWNNIEMEETISQGAGAHIYFHGHIHKPIGIALNHTVGRNITVLGGGACYQNLKYPMHFAFYDVDISQQIISPSTYEYDLDDGSWFLTNNGVGSKPIRTVLPLIQNAKPIKNIRQENEELKGRVDELETRCEKLRLESVNSHYALNSYTQESVARGGYHHYFESIRIMIDIDQYGNASIAEVFRIKAKSVAVHLWVNSIFVDEQSHPIEDIGQTKIRYVPSDEGDIDMIPVIDEPRRKKMIATFKPMIEPNQSRTFTRIYEWSGYVPHLMEGETVVFEYYHPEGDEPSVCDFTFQLNIEKKVGDVVGYKVGEHRNHELKLTKSIRGTNYSFEYTDKTLNLKNGRPTFNFKLRSKL
jgi:hypothetical protein